MKDPSHPAVQATVHLVGSGRIQGVLEDGIAIYRGIRYAQSPFGALRFQAPQPVPAWTGVVSAHAFAAASPQAPRSAGEGLYGGLDCLALNIWAPPRGDAPHPVMVWIPGGAYMRGDAADPVYDGAAFARQGIVFVSLNYRVGIDGFMQIPGAPANRGLLDQIAALRWIQQHIASFGGDARRLTVAGGSAGAGAIACLMGMPAASGLFSQAILQSPSVATQSPEEAQLAADAVAQVLQVPLTQDALAQVPLPAAIAALQRLADEPRLREALGLSTRNFFPLRAVVDGEVLSAAPLHALRSSWIRQLPTFSLLVGCNREEMRLYTVPTGAIAQTTEAQLAQFVRDIGLQASAAQADGEQAHHSPGERLCALQSDYYYRVPARRIAADVAQMGLRSYLYEFAWRSPRCDGQLGAAHGLDIPFVFAQTQSRAGAQIAGVPAPEALASLMHSSWARFVKHGAPGWSRHTPEQRHIMRWDTTSACVLDDEDRTRAIWGAAL